MIFALEQPSFSVEIYGYIQLLPSTTCDQGAHSSDNRECLDLLLQTPSNCYRSPVEYDKKGYSAGFHDLVLYNAMPLLST
jgi:hypothetical protein